MRLSLTASRIITVVCLLLLIGCAYLIATISIPTFTTASSRRVSQPTLQPGANATVQAVPTLTPASTLSGQATAQAGDQVVRAASTPALLPTSAPAQVTPIPTILSGGSALSPQDQQLFDQANNFTVGADSMRFSFALTISVLQNADQARWQYSAAGVVTGMSDLTQFGMQVDDSRLPLPINDQFIEAIGYFVVYQGSVYLAADVPALNARILPIQFDMETMMCSALSGFGGDATLDLLEQDGQDCIDDAVSQAFEAGDLSSVYSAMSLGRFVTTVRGTEQNGLTPYISTVDIPGLLTSPEFSTFIMGAMGSTLGMDVAVDPAMMATFAAQLPTLEAYIPTLQATDPALAQALQEQIDAHRQLEQGEIPAGGAQASLGITAADLPPMTLTIQHWVETANPRIRQVIINFDARLDDPQNAANTTFINVNALVNLEGFNQAYTITPLQGAAEVTDFLNFPPDRLTILNP